MRVGSSTWTHDVGVRVSGSSLIKTAAVGWNSGAISANTLEAGDGAMEFTATEVNTTRVAGLSDGDVNQGWEDIAFGIKVRDDATIEVVESGTSRGTFGSYAAGDRFRVEVVSGVVTYAQNDSVFYASTLAPSYPMVVDTALYSAGATLTDVVLVPLVWTNLSGVAVSENSLTKTAGDGWNAGAQTTFALTGGSGYLEFKAIETDKRRTVGFRSGTGTAQTYADLAYAIDLGATGSVTVFEDGVSRGAFGSYAHGDRFRIEVSEGAVRYLRNATVLYASSTAPTYPLRGDVRLYSEGATVADLLGGTEPWMSRVNLTAMGSSFVKTGGANSVWDAEALSSCGFATGFIEFTASQTMCGATSGSPTGTTAPTTPIWTSPSTSTRSDSFMCSRMPRMSGISEAMPLATGSASKSPMASSAISAMARCSTRVPGPPPCRSAQTSTSTSLAPPSLTPVSAASAW